MEKSDVITRQKGTGYLILKSGIVKQVGWEIDLLRDGSIVNGIIRGDEQHLAAASDDGCANLRLSVNTSAAIAIDGFENEEASFTTLLVSSALFRAQTITGSGPILDGNEYSIEFSGADGEHHLVIVPTTIMRDYLPILEKLVPPSSTDSPSTAFFRIAKTWEAGTAREYSFVVLKFDDEPPVALTPEESRELAKQLIEGAETIDTRLRVAH
jgi:hypothetical protein